MKKKQLSAFKFKPFSRKQKQLLTWWRPGSPYADYDMIICDGSIRSGKTVAQILSFMLWSFSFEGKDFILAGKSMGALKRNVIKPMRQMLRALGIENEYNRSENYIVCRGNTYYLFGANNEASQDVLQGLTAAGAYLDEAALFPRSFVEQAIGRCSEDGAKIWMNCNPGPPFHYLKTEYIDQAKEKRILHLHFELDDNLTLSERVKQRYRRMFSGVFFKRYILGLWVAAEGAIYDMFDPDKHVVKELPQMVRCWVGIDYGTSNPTVFAILGKGIDDKFYIFREFRWDSAKKMRQLTDQQYSKEFQKWLGSAQPRWVFIDPSAASFKLQLFRDKVKNLADADNSVLDGIRRVSSLLGADLLYIHESCSDGIREMSGYVWDLKKQEHGEDAPLKAADHFPDVVRYLINGTEAEWGPILRKAA